MHITFVVIDDINSIQKSNLCEINIGTSLYI